jgi:hypothetical protein
MTDLAIKWLFCLVDFTQLIIAKILILSIYLISIKFIL